MNAPERTSAGGERLMAASETLTRVPPRGIPQPRQFGIVNWRGVWTLYVKEVQRFMKVASQTVLAPTVTTLLFLTIFSLALGGATRMVGEVPFTQFLAPGLIMMAMVQNSFANTSSTISIGKVQGSIVDVLMPPLSPAELMFGWVMGGATRGVLVGLAVGGAVSFFVPMRLADIGAIVFFAAAASVMLSTIGLMTGIWAEKFDQTAAITNFVITPLAFLSGTFYSVERLPGIWHTVSQFNPFFYMIDGFRYGFIGRSDGSVVVGVIVMLALNAALWGACQRMIATGYKLKD